MRIGVPKEIKVHEYRVGMTPAAVTELVSRGHQVAVETNAGAGVDYSDEQYVAAGATIVAEARAVFEGADLVVKVKEPQLHECAWLKPNQTLFTYLHLAADPEQAEALKRSGATCIAYETVTDARGALPLLRPMSEVAGRMSVQVGAHYLEKAQGGCGVLLGGVPGVEPAKVVILGGGVSGIHAAEMAVGLRADTTIYDISTARLAELDLIFDGPGEDRLRLQGGHRRRGGAGAPGDRRRADPRRLSPQAGDPRHAEDHAPRRSAGGHRHRPGRLLRDLSRHHPQPTRCSPWTRSSTTASPTCRARSRAPALRR